MDMNGNLQTQRYHVKQQPGLLRSWGKDKSSLKTEAGCQDVSINESTGHGPAFYPTGKAHKSLNGKKTRLGAALATVLSVRGWTQIR